MFIRLLSIVLLAGFSLAVQAAEGEAVTLSPVSYSSSFLQMLLGLAFVVAMIFLVIGLMKKLGYKGYNTTGHIQIKSNLTLSAKEKILLIEVGDEQILVGVSAGGINHIKTLDKPVEGTQNTESSPSPFSEKLKQMLSNNHAMD